MSVSRRDFVCRAGAALAGVPVAQLLAGCAGATMYRVTPLSGQLRLDLQSLPELEFETGVAMLSVEGSETPLFVVRQNPTTYLTLSSVCTHRGCTVESKRDRFVCPCHGSTYSRLGDVMKGPAEQALRRYRTELQPNGRTLVIDFQPSGPAR
jgi:cytochrome b6-f complex iron-sulfur subunit